MVSYKTGLAVLVLAYLAYWYTTMRIPDHLEVPSKTRLSVAIWRGMDFLAMVPKSLGICTELDLRRWLDRMMAVKAPRDEGVKISDETFDGIPVRMYRPEKRTENGPSIVFVHGGGWSRGSVDNYDILMWKMARIFRLVMIAVEYRKAPENPFPAGYIDCEKAITYFLNNAAKYGLDPNRVALAGDSAGGNLAAAVSHTLLANKHPVQPKLQLLLYGKFQVMTSDLPGYSLDGVLLNRRGTFTFLSDYLNLKVSGKLVYEKDCQVDPSFWRSPDGQRLNVVGAVPEDMRQGFVPMRDSVNAPDCTTPLSMEVQHESAKFMSDHRLQPLMADNFKGLPPAYVLIAGHDIIRDDSYLYARALKDAGVDCTVRLWPKGLHGFISLDMLQPKMANKALREMAVFVGERL